MKLSEELQQHDDSGDSGRAFEGLAERAEALEMALEDTKLFANWVECLGRTDCEIYKHELKGSADLAIYRINRALDDGLLEG
jgi:hypothetical protein